MPSCSNCSKVQAKLCKGAVCKPCFNKKINGDSMATNIDVGDSLSSDRLVIDMIKENMTQERQWNAEIISHLKDSIEHLKHEAHSKNALIKELIIELRNVRSSCTIGHTHFRNCDVFSIENQISHNMHENFPPRISLLHK